MKIFGAGLKALADDVLERNSPSRATSTAKVIKEINHFTTLFLSNCNHLALQSMEKPRCGEAEQGGDLLSQFNSNPS